MTAIDAKTALYQSLTPTALPKEAPTQSTASDEQQEAADKKAKEIARIQKTVRDTIKSNKRSNLYTKLYAGKSLTPSELQYAKEHAPELYQEAQKMEQTRRRYRQTLSSCRSKESAQDTHKSKIQSLTAYAAKGHHRTASAVGSVQAEINILNDEYQKFKNSPAYQKLPTHSRKAKGSINKKI